MKLFGYLKNKNVVRCDLTPSDIVRLNIDPWQLDLFEANPIELVVNGITVFFSPLRETCFALSAGEDIYIGIVLGSSRVTLKGRADIPVRASIHSPRLEVTQCAVSAVPFAKLFERFLAVPSVLVKKHGPCPPAWIEMVGSKCSLPMSYRSTVFTGQMFQPVSVQTKPHPQIARIFELFDAWKPVVFGECLTRARSTPAAKEDRFHLKVPTDRGADFDQFLKSLFENAYHDRCSGEWSCVDYPNGCEYKIRLKSDTLGGTVTSWGQGTPYVISQWLVECNSPVEMRFSRIALFDLLSNQNRHILLPPPLQEAASAAEALEMAPHFADEYWQASREVPTEHAHFSMIAVRPQLPPVPEPRCNMVPQWVDISDLAAVDGVPA